MKPTLVKKEFFNYYQKSFIISVVVFLAGLVIGLLNLV